METIVFVLLALDASLVGVLGGVLLFRSLARKVEEKQDRAEKPVSKVLIIRPNDRAKESLEILLKNAETAKTPVSFQRIEQNLLRGTEAATGKNAALFIKQDNPLNKVVPGESESINHKTLKTPESLQQIEQNLLKGTDVAGKNAAVLIKQDITLNQIVSGESKGISHKTISVRESHKKTRQPAFIRELETNLTIATAPWKDQPVPFQTACWEAKIEKVEPGMVSHLQDLIQLYADINLANNVVWLATEIGHRSKELDESYLKLSSGIAERIKGIIPMFNEAILPIDITS